MKNQTHAKTLQNLIKVAKQNGTFWKNDLKGSCIGFAEFTRKLGQLWRMNWMRRMFL